MWAGKTVSSATSAFKGNVPNFLPVRQSHSVFVLGMAEAEIWETTEGHGACDHRGTWGLRPPALCLDSWPARTRSQQFLVAV